MSVLFGQTAEELLIALKKQSKLGIISLAYSYLCGIPRRHTALVLKNIEVNFIFLARLCVSLQ